MYSNTKNNLRRKIERLKEQEKFDNYDKWMYSVLLTTLNIMNGTYKRG